MVTGASASGLTSPSDLPGPLSLPLLGNLHQAPPHRLHLALEQWGREYGALFSYRLGPTRMVGIADASTVHELLRKRPESCSRSQTLEPIFRELGIEGLFPAEGEQWQRHRRVWMRTMSAHNIKPFFGRVTEMTERLHQRWRQAASNDEVIDPTSSLMRYTVDVVTLFAYGYDGNTLEKGEDVIQRHLQELFPAINRRAAIRVPYWRYLPAPADLRLRRAIRAIRKFAFARIDDARKRLDDDPTLREAPDNLLEGLIAAGEGTDDQLSDEEIVGNTIIALAAGEDTTALSIAWAIHELLAHPEAFDRLRTEVDEVLGAANLWEDLEAEKAMPFLSAVISETMRLRPAAPINSAAALTDIDLAGRRMPAGTQFVFSTRSAALDPGNFERPESYEPSRWLADGRRPFQQEPPYPFGIGKRTCPGMNLALLEMKSVLTMLVRNFDLERANDAAAVRERLDFTMRPENLRIRLRERECGAL